jgi:hypothetical protein
MLLFTSEVFTNAAALSEQTDSSLVSARNESPLLSVLRATGATLSRTHSTYAHHRIGVLGAASSARAPGEEIEMAKALGHI